MVPSLEALGEVVSRDNGLARQRCCRSAPSLVVCNVVRKHGDGTIHWTELSLPVGTWSHHSKPIHGAFRQGGPGTSCGQRSGKETAVEVPPESPETGNTICLPTMVSEMTRMEGVIIL